MKTARGLVEKEWSDSEAKRKQTNGKRKDDRFDLNTNTSSLINGDFIHYVVLRAFA